jgi:hypothetical protein
VNDASLLLCSLVGKGCAKKRAFSNLTVKNCLLRLLLPEIHATICRMASHS